MLLCTYKIYKFPLTGPPALTVNITENTKNSSIVVQWDEVDDSLTTTYIVAWINELGHTADHATLTEQSSYTITKLTVDSVYTIAVTASNKCGQGPEYSTSVSLIADTTPTMSPTLTAGIIPIMFMSSVYSDTTTAIINLSAATTTTAMINLDTNSIAAAAATTSTTTTTTTNIVIISYVTPTSTACLNLANATTADKTCKF